MEVMCQYANANTICDRISIGILAHYFYRTGNSVIRKVVHP